MATKETKKYTSLKKKAVLDMMKNVKPKLTKSESQKAFRTYAKKYNLTVDALTRAYENFLNFKKIDLRITNKKHPAEFSVDNVSKKYKELCTIPFKEYTTKEIKMLFLEYYFGTKKKVSDFLDENQINPSQWYNWIRNFKITGKIGNSKVFDFTKYAKPIDVNVVLRYAKQLTRSNAFNSAKPLSKSAKEKIACLRNLRGDEEKLVMRLVRVLYMYCSTNHKKHVK